ncbi:MAG: hypothetical protein GXP31_03385 [Kiritimatiellaeota bacterium]|nr:hypothetical protein [Kiritimatiellota bacterium]
MKRVRHILELLLALRPGVWAVATFWSGLFLQNWLYFDNRDAAIMVLTGEWPLRHLTTDLPLVSATVFVIGLALLLVELVRVLPGPRRSCWEAVRWVCGGGAAAFVAAWWLRMNIREHSWLWICIGRRTLWDELAYAFVLVPVSGLVLVLLLAQRRRAEGSSIPPRWARSYWISALVIVSGGLGALILAPPCEPSVVNIAAFPIVLVILIVLTAAALEGVVRGKDGQLPISLLFAPNLLTGAGLPMVVVAAAAGLRLAVSGVGSLYIKNVDDRLVPAWNHPELLQYMTGRIYRVKRKNEAGDLQFFDVQTGQWRSMPHTPPPEEFLMGSGKWDVEGDYLAYVPSQPKRASIPEAKLVLPEPETPGMVSRRRSSALPAPPPNWRKVRVVSLEDGRRVTSIDVSTLPNEKPSCIRRLRIAPDTRKLAVLFERRLLPRFDSPAGRPSRRRYAVAIYELPTGKLIRVLGEVDLIHTPLDWLLDSRHILVSVSGKRPAEKRKARAARSRRPFWLASVDVTTDRVTTLLPGLWFDLSVSPTTGNIVAYRDGKIVVVPPPGATGRVEKTRTFSMSRLFFSFQGISPDERLLLGSAVVPTVEVVSVPTTCLLIVDARSPETAHILQRNDQDCNYYSEGDGLLWRRLTY